MSASMCALLGFTALTVGLILVVLFYRTSLVFFRGKAATSWTRGNQTAEDPGIMTRIGHAQSNCVENLPVVVAVLLAAQAMGQGQVTDPLACWLLFARLGQSAVHVIAVNHWMVMIRATLFTAQLAIIVYWLLKLSGLV